MEKAETYARLKIRLKKALSAGFWFEAVLIEYAMMEDRTASILFHSGVLGENAYSEKKSLKNKLHSIDYQIGKKHPILSKKITSDLISETDLWRDERNTAVHCACMHSYDENQMRTLAEQGKKLTDLLVNAARRVQNASNKLKKETEQ